MIAFKNYSVNMGFSGIWTSEWVGLRWFQEFFGFYRFKDIFLNTVILSVLKLIFTFPAPILLAVLISELKSRYFKRVVQTVSYLPNFISWVLLYTIANSFLTTQGGIINSILMNPGITDAPIAFMTFTLPGIRSAAVTVLIMSIGGLMGGGMGGSNFEQAFIFGNPFNNAVSEIMQTYSFEVGLVNGRFAYATAVDVVRPVISVTLIPVSNTMAKKITGEGIGLVMLIWFLMFMFLTVCYRYFNREYADRIAVRVQTLERNMQNLLHEEFTKISSDHVEEDDELDYVIDYYNHLLEKVQALFRSRIRDEQEKRRLERS